MTPEQEKDWQSTILFHRRAAGYLKNEDGSAKVPSAREELRHHQLLLTIDSELSRLRRELGEAQGKLCRAREAFEKTTDHLADTFLWKKVRAALSDSAPCPHAERVKVLEEELRCVNVCCVGLQRQVDAYRRAFGPIDTSVTHAGER